MAYETKAPQPQIPGGVVWNKGSPAPKQLMRYADADCCPEHARSHEPPCFQNECRKDEGRGSKTNPSRSLFWHIFIFIPMHNKQRAIPYNIHNIKDSLKEVTQKIMGTDYRAYSHSN